MAKKWSWSLMRGSNNRNLTGKILVFWIGGRTWKLDYIFLLSAHEENLWCFVLKFVAFKP